jgi:hypothetical protein
VGPVTIEDQEFFLLSPLNRWFLTGDVSEPEIPTERKYLHWALGIAAGTLFLVAGACFDAGNQAWWLRYKLQADGVRGQGTVLELRKEASDNGPVHYARFKFDAATPQGMKTFRNERHVKESTYKSLRVGGPIAIFYSAGSPELSKVNHELPPEPWTDTITCLVTLILCLGSAFWARKVRDRLNLLLAEGRVVSGTLCDCKGEVDSEGDYMVDLHYEFRTPEERVIYGHHRAVASEMRHQSFPEPGTPVAVLFADESNYQLL